MSENMKIEFEEGFEVEHSIEHCQEQNHIQQVAYSTYHGALTQICFTCKKIRTSIQL